MVEGATNLEIALVLKTAEEYRRKGYEVTIEECLDFPPGFVADLVARKGDDTRVVEVKSRASLAANPRIGEVARILETKPGWSFDLILVGEPEKLESPAGARAYDREGIAARIQESEELLRLAHPDAAFLAAWAACEAAVRLLVSEKGITSDSITTPSYVLEQATYLGLISREEYSTLTELQKHRNAIIHGFINDEFKHEMVIDLIEATRGMIAAA